ncbi:MAG: rhomboid family intramembrane serine protease [Thermogutta sp.]|nr:rhomboid family intramembrane serine protease [Thermogutta sp.]
MGWQDRDYFRTRHTAYSSGGWSGPQSAIAWIVLINVIVYVADALTDYQIRRWTAAHVDTIKQPWLWWQFVTYGFTHEKAFDHIFFNMLTLWLFGREIEYLYGRAEFTRLYLVLITAGGVLWSVTNTISGSPDIGLVGASGGVVGIFLLFCLHFPRRTILLFFFLPVPAWVAGLFLIVPDILGALQVSTGGQIAYSVHLTGAMLAALYYHQGWNFGRMLEALGRQKIVDRWHMWTQRRPRLRVRRPQDEIFPGDDESEEDEAFEKLQREVDRILDKIAREGTESLTRQERRTMQRASQLFRERLSGKR